MLPPPSDASTSEVGSHAGTLDLTGGNNWENQQNRDGGGPSAGPSMEQNVKSALCWMALLTPFIIAVVLSANSLQESNEALELAKANSLAIQSSKQKLNSITENINAAAGVGPHPEDEWLQIIATSPPTSKPTPSPTTADRPTEPHPLNPQWFQTTHQIYQMIVDSYEEGNNSNLLHSYRVADQVCKQNQLVLCDYDSYCPNGQGSKPIGGGPPQVHNYDLLHVTQWSPYQHNDKVLTSDPAFTNWVQIGMMEEEKGGKESNNFVQCWKYDDWYAGSEGKDIEEDWGEEHRMWMLCCEKPEET